MIFIELFYIYCLKKIKTDIFASQIRRIFDATFDKTLKVLNEC